MSDFQNSEKNGNESDPIKTTIMTINNYYGDGDGGKIILCVKELKCL